MDFCDIVYVRLERRGCTEYQLKRVWVGRKNNGVYKAYEATMFNATMAFKVRYFFLDFLFFK
jgi:hypothetical protein